jgi:hypothetical protein
MIPVMRLRDFGLRLLGLGLFASAWVSACGGSQFSASEGTGGRSGSGGTSGESGAPATGGTGGSSATGGTGGTGGTARGGTTLCTQALDCDDGNPCTVDSCNENGVCEKGALCADGQLCCDGVCSECCGTADCLDGRECTDDVCFDGFCTNPPNDVCAANEICGDTGCVPREQCSGNDGCDDGNPCTTDTCVDGFCDNAECPDGGVCCENVGCGTCCIDAQCANEDTDPCTSNKCVDGQCTTEPRCEPGKLCCPALDGQTATCGTECCNAMQCPDDGVECTATLCVAGLCKNQVMPDSCGPNETCDPVEGCTGGGGCMDVSDCTAPGDACETVSCNESGTCVYGDVECSDGQKCCSNLATSGGHCRGCCDNGDCTSGGSNQLCCPADGACHECCQDTDCGLAVAKIATPPVIGGNCVVPVCQQGVCGSKPLCRSDQVCCNGACQPLGTPCVDPAF